MERRDYLELMTGQIRCKKMCPVIAKEVEDHIEDQKQVFMAEGMKEEEAEKAAVEEMGDPVEVGVEMDQIHRPKMPWKAIFVIALMQILSGMFAAFFLKQNESYGYIAGIRQIFRLAMAFSVMILVCYMDYSWIGKHARLLAGSYLSITIGSPACQPYATFAVVTYLMISSSPPSLYAPKLSPMSLFKSILYMLLPFFTC